MQYLIDLGGRHRQSGAATVFRFCVGPAGYNTRPDDDVPNVHYQPRINSTGDYRRALFGGQGRTTGAAEVDRGEILLNNSDGGLDRLLEYAFDGYDLTIWSLPNARARFGTRQAVFRGTVEQVDVTWEEIRLRIRTRLAILDKPIQEAVYAGTTIAGGMIEAEGDENLKDAPRAILYGAPKLVAPVLVNRFDQVYGVGHKLSAVRTVRDAGEPLTATGQDYPTLAALLASTIAGGFYATCLALGLIRLGPETTQGTITVEAVEGAAPADRTAGKVVRRILMERAGLVPGVDFLDSDIAALDAANSAEVQFWPGASSVNMLAAISAILDSIGASISPDRLGVFRLVRFDAPKGEPKRTFTHVEIVEANGTGIQRLATGDSGGGLPAKSITVQHSLNHAVMAEDSLSGSTRETNPDFVAFVTKEWRQEEVKDDATAELHKLAPKLSFQTLLVDKAAAKAEATRRMALYGRQRDRYDVPVPSRYAGDLDLGDVVRLRLPRFGMDDGKLFTIVGMREDLGDGVTTLDLWG
ncbi:hypothetical protein [Aureimonas sp. SK2]|uniref:hypothetical protein n=1 Tax=Aureimonas sp. SK2 TaxID=3015992 RepID=UPI002443C841|nr:hypothetical protein [Aureimonas sp. SK2]